MITIKTNHGDIKLELTPEKTPKTVENFLNYAKSGFYDNTIFHRVIEGFMVQGGGFTPEMADKGDKNEPIENEADLGIKNAKGTIAMARTNDPHSASSQFFINVSDNSFLDHKSKDMHGWGYCAFGQIVEGQEVADKIAKVSTTSKMGHDDVPEENVIIETIEVAE
jgi:peptidyl-prolyl cis-trans isomerase B (cyclophilin B)